MCFCGEFFFINFNTKKSAAEGHRIFVEVNGENALSEQFVGFGLVALKVVILSSKTGNDRVNPNSGTSAE